jgi:hypothetical protein
MSDSIVGDFTEEELNELSLSALKELLFWYGIEYPSNTKKKDFIHKLFEDAKIKEKESVEMSVRIRRIKHAN